MTADDRQAKLAAALRANLRRRKAASEPAPPPPPPPPAASEPEPNVGEDRH